MTASVNISFDGATPVLVNITQMYDLTYSSSISYPIFAWSALDLDPNIEHTFFLQYDEPTGLVFKWAGFDSIVFTEPTINPSSSSS